MNYSNLVVEIFELEEVLRIRLTHPRSARLFRFDEVSDEFKVVVYDAGNTPGVATSIAEAAGIEATGYAVLTIEEITKEMVVGKLVPVE